MTWQTLLLFLLLAVQAGPPQSVAPANGGLHVTAEAPIVTVTRTAPGRRFLSLPTLQYVFEVGAHCSGRGTPESLSINVADSRLSLSSAALEADERPAILMTVPARQLAPIAVDGFCEFEDEIEEGEESSGEIALGIAPLAAGPDRLTVSAALSAQISMLCGTEDEPRMTYVSKPLDVTLSCGVPPDVPPERQPAPDPVPRR
jgi:hypothetical protein